MTWESFWHISGLQDSAVCQLPGSRSVVHTVDDTIHLFSVLLQCMPCLACLVAVHAALVVRAAMSFAGDSGARSYFVLGFDIAVDTQLRVWVMEV